MAIRNKQAIKTAEKLARERELAKVLQLCCLHYHHGLIAEQSWRGGGGRFKGKPGTREGRTLSRWECGRIVEI